ncbi:MAG: TlpA family protein disulfide reductase [Myxococcota bacterium]
MELRQRFEGVDDLAVLWVMADNQVNAKTLRFIDSLGLRQRVQFGVDPGSAAIDQLGVRLENPEPIEVGVPNPTTLIVDAGGVVRFVDVRRDYHAWLDPGLLEEALASLR